MLKPYHIEPVDVDGLINTRPFFSVRKVWRFLRKTQICLVSNLLFDVSTGRSGQGVALEDSTGRDD
jgi:hypothetical protein